MLQDLEDEFLKRYKKSITFHECYVDDSFIIIVKNNLKLLIKFLNNYYPRLSFTYEIEKYNSISFLDVALPLEDILSSFSFTPDKNC